MGTTLILLAVAIAVGLLYRGRGYAAWSLGAAAALLAWLVAGVQSPWLFGLVALTAGAAAWVFGREELRRRLVSARAMPIVARLLPRLGATERVALEAGTVWWDGDLFSGQPDWRKLLAFSPRRLSPAERAFLDGPVEKLCAMRTAISSPASQTGASCWPSRPGGSRPRNGPSSTVPSRSSARCLTTGRSNRRATCRPRCGSSSSSSGSSG
jgi:hypothetical protein